MRGVTVRPSRLSIFACFAFAAYAAACGGTAPAPTTEPQPEPTSASAAGKADSIFGWGDDVDYADMSNTVSIVTRLPVRGRLVEEDEDEIDDPDVTPLSQLSQDEIDYGEITLRMRVGEELVDVGTTRASEEGYFDQTLDVARFDLQPGRHVVEVYHDGDHVGDYRALLLAKDDPVPVVRSDVDLTYLNTDFQSTSAMWDLLRADASEREALPGMPQVYAGIRGDDAIGITFVTGSPRFFKRTLEQKMSLDGVDADGLVLKPLKDIVASNLWRFDFDALMPAIKEQVGYKLYWLLHLRTELPTSTPEVLMGDDSEADFVVYALYDRLLTGELDVAGLQARLDELDVTRDWLDQLLPEAERVVAMHPAAPIAIYINATKVPGEHHSITDWTVEGRTRHHNGAWPLVLDLYEEGLVDRAVVEDVHAGLEAAGLSDDAIAATAADADFLEPETASTF
jgi:hypothetical protein